jgi:hypothetical protein
VVAGGVRYYLRCVVTSVWSVLNGVLHTHKIILCDITPVYMYTINNISHTRPKQHHITTGIGTLLSVGFHGSRPCLDDLQTGTVGAYVCVCSARFLSHTLVKIVCGVFGINQVVGVGL